MNQVHPTLANNFIQLWRTTSSNSSNSENAGSTVHLHWERHWTVCGEGMQIKNTSIFESVCFRLQ
jgi:hypothetical protein